MTASGQTPASTVRCDCNGFTLIELVTVLMIFGLVAFIALPRFPRSESVSGQDQLMGWFRNQDERLRYQSVRLQRRFSIHISVSDQRVWVTHAAMTPEEIEMAVATGLALADDLRIDRVTRPLDEPDGEITAAVQIRYFPQGVSDMAEITIAESGRPDRQIHIRPFLGITADPVENRL